MWTPDWQAGLWCVIRKQEACRMPPPHPPSPPACLQTWSRVSAAWLIVQPSSEGLCPASWDELVTDDLLWKRSTFITDQPYNNPVPGASRILYSFTYSGHVLGFTVSGSTGSCFCAFAVHFIEEKSSLTRWSCYSLVRGNNPRSWCCLPTPASSGVTDII